MGQAKNRGSFDQRKTDAITREEVSHSSFLSEIRAPVDPEIFSYLFEVYSAAAANKIPGVDPTTRRMSIDTDTTFAFTNIPQNRGMVAADNELREMGVEKRAGYITRLMHVGDVLEVGQAWADEFVSCGDDIVLVSPHLIKAMAVARFICEPGASGYMDDGSMGFDMEDVHTKAKEFRDAEDVDRAKGSRGVRERG